MKCNALTAIIILLLASFAIQAVEPAQLSVEGIIESSVGGFKFPDGSVQQSAATSSAPVCTVISSLPTTISSAGVYCLNGNLNTTQTSGIAIEIIANDVVIDLNGWRLDIQSVPTEITQGISADQQSNITIRNGTVQGFGIGINLSGLSPYTTSSDHIVEDIRVIDCILAGIHVQGSNSMIRRNHISDCNPPDITPFGIWFYGSDGRILDNDINNVGSPFFGGAEGIRVDDSDYVVIEGNRISHLGPGGLVSDSYALHVVTSDDVLVRANSIAQADWGIVFSPDSTGSTGKYMDNMTTNVGTAYVGGTAAGTSNY